MPNKGVGPPADYPKDLPRGFDREKQKSRKSVFCFFGYIPNREPRKVDRKMRLDEAHLSKKDRPKLRVVEGVERPKTVQEDFG